MFARLSVSPEFPHTAALLAHSYGNERPHPSTPLTFQCHIHKRCFYRSGKHDLDKEKVLPSREREERKGFLRTGFLSPWNAGRQGEEGVLEDKCVSAILIRREEASRRTGTKGSGVMLYSRWGR